MKPTVTRLARCAGLLAAPLAAASPPIFLCEPGERVDPISVAQIYVIDGVEVIGAPIPYAGFGSHLNGFALSYDMCQGDQTVASDFPPIGGNVPPCALAAPSTRYYFGSTAANPHFCNDYNGQDVRQVHQRIRALSFYWLHFPPSGQERFIADVFWYNEFNGNCGDFPGSDTINAARGFIAGARLDFGSLVADVTYYRSTIDLTALNLPNMPDQDGAYEMKFLRVPTTSAPVGADFSTRSQPMLWGTQGDAPFGNYQGQPRPGTAGQPAQWDDDVPLDNTFAVPGECYGYGYGLCYNPLGATAAWFRDACVLPPAFSLIAPPDGAGCFLAAAGITFSWEVSAPQAWSYTLKISAAPDMSEPVYVQDDIVLGSWQVPPNAIPPCIDTLYWQVTAAAAHGCPGRDSTIRAFHLRTADINNDGQIDFFDYLDFAQAFAADAAAADFNCDQQIDFFDYLDFAQAFAACS